MCPHKKNVSINYGNRKSNRISRAVGVAQLLERIQKDIISPNETHVPNEVGHRK